MLLMTKTNGFYATINAREEYTRFKNGHHNDDIMKNPKLAKYSLLSFMRYLTMRCMYVH